MSCRRRSAAISTRSSGPTSPRSKCSNLACSAANTSPIAETNIPRKLVRARQALALRPRLLLELFRRGRQPTLVGVAKERLDACGRSARLVPVVLPLLHGAAAARRGRPPDWALESVEAPRVANQETLRVGRSDVPAATEPN